MRSPSRGEIYRLQSDAVGKPRPVLVLSPKVRNGGGYITCVPFFGTNPEIKASIPTNVLFRAGEFGLEKDCVAVGNLIGPYRLSDLRISEGPVGTVDATRLPDVDQAIRAQLGL